MSFNQIVLKNFKQNIRHYAMYIFSLIVSIVPCVTITIVAFIFLFISSKRFNKSCALLESSAPVGSSAKIIAGLCTEARAHVPQCINQLLSLPTNQQVHLILKVRRIY